MPIIKSAEKRMRQAEIRRRRNVGYKKSIKSDTKTVVASIESKDLKGAADALKKAISQIDRAIKKGVLHKNTGARRKSRLTLKYNKAAKAPYGTENPGTAKKKPITKKPTAKADSKAKAPAKKAPAKKSTK